MKNIAHNDIVSYKGYRYRVCCLTDNDVVLERFLRNGNIEEVTLSRNDTRIEGIKLRNTELLRYGFVEDGNAMKFKDIKWMSGHVTIQQKPMPRKIKYLHELQHLLAIFRPQYKIVYRNIPRKRNTAFELSEEDIKVLSQIADSLEGNGKSTEIPQ